MCSVVVRKHNLNAWFCFNQRQQDRRINQASADCEFKILSMQSKFFFPGLKLFRELFIHDTKLKLAV